MDRVKSSMQQVPNPIPKVLSRRTGGANSLEAEKENFERSQVRNCNRDGEVIFSSCSQCNRQWPLRIATNFYIHSL